MKGVLLLAYGTPRSLDEVEEYYTNIRGGRKPSDAEVANLVERYKAIGGVSPLIRITESLRNKLRIKLASDDSDTLVYSAMKHSEPFISEVVADAAKNGVDELLSIALAPHYSKMSVGTYMLAVELANEALSRKMRLESISSWHAHPVFIRAWADNVRLAERKLGGDYSLVFSAHSLPEIIRKQNDPYIYELLETSELVANALGRKSWSFAFQSAGRTKEPWLGPDILDHLQSQFDKGQRRFLIAPIGFVSDHLEILYDIDIECKKWADDHDAMLGRCDSLNDSDALVNCLQSIVLERHFE